MRLCRWVQLACDHRRSRRRLRLPREGASQTHLRRHRCVTAVLPKVQTACTTFRPPPLPIPYVEDRLLPLKQTAHHPLDPGQHLLTRTPRGEEGQDHDPVDGGAERWPPPGAGDVLAALLPRVLDPMGREPERKEPRRSGDARRGDHHECHRDTALDDDDPPSVGHREADVDRGDHGESEGVDGRRIEPPERERRRCLDHAHDDSPGDRRTHRRLVTPGSEVISR